MKYKRFKGYSCPNVRINTVPEYEIRETEVICKMKIKVIQNGSAYAALRAFAEQVLDMSSERDSVSSDKHFDPHSYQLPDDDSKVYDITAQTYVGIARYKKGDAHNIEYAKKVAYKKAYRQMLSFYGRNYLNLYNRVQCYMKQVCRGQITKIENKKANLNLSLLDLIYNDDDEKMARLSNYGECNLKCSD